MVKVEIEIEDEKQAYLLCLILADQGAEHDKKAYDWTCNPGRKGDEVWQRLTKDAKWLYALSAAVAKQTKTLFVKPVENAVDRPTAPPEKS